jgi:hypothetical protein
MGVEVHLETRDHTAFEAAKEVQPKPAQIATRVAVIEPILSLLN